MENNWIHSKQCETISKSSNTVFDHLAAQILSWPQTSHVVNCNQSNKQLKQDETISIQPKLKLSVPQAI